MTGLNCSKYMPVEEMFEDRYIPEPNSGCWLWLGYGDKNGYGTFYPRGERWKAHRYSWFIHNGSIPDGLMVCHHCDMPACVNPNHLFLGTNKNNLQDMVDKGRGPTGAKNPSAKLSEIDINPIRNDSRPYPEIAKDYDITAQNVCYIKQRKTWKHVA